MLATLLIATANAGKVKEIRHEFERAAAAAHDSFLASLRILGLKDLPPIPDCVEDQPTFEGNAAKKARHFAHASGLLTLADDSGLCVNALGGAPGVYSARYAGISGPAADAANNAKLLAAMENIPDHQRHAQFVCAMALALPVRSSRFSVPPLPDAPPPQTDAPPPLATPQSTINHQQSIIPPILARATGEVHGILLRSPRGANGFGYDPLFFFPQFQKTTAELDLTAKSLISHRGQALRKIIAWLHDHHASLPTIHD